MIRIPRLHASEDYRTIAQLGVIEVAVGTIEPSARFEAEVFVRVEIRGVRCRKAGRDVERYPCRVSIVSTLRERQGEFDYKSVIPFDQFRIRKLGLHTL